MHARLIFDQKHAQFVAPEAWKCILVTAVLYRPAFFDNQGETL